MKAIHFDAATGREIQAHEASQQSHVTNFCSWQRLRQVFKDAGETFPSERIVAFQIDERGITYRVAPHNIQQRAE
jgi:hypothetical protein